MPINGYVCTECGDNSEVWATISEKEKGLRIVCQKCGSRKMPLIFAGVSTDN